MRYLFALLLLAACASEEAADELLDSSEVAETSPKKLEELPKVEAAAPKKEDFPRVVKLSRASAVYEKPSGQSKVVADAEAGTPLIARELSPQGQWLRVEDEDGHRGWIPKARTDFAEILAPPPPAEKAPEEDLMAEAEAEEKKAQPKIEKPVEEDQGTSLHSLSFVALNIGSRAGGAELAFMAPVAGSSLGEGARVWQFGLDLGALKTWSEKDLGAALYFARLRLLAQDPASEFGSGPDLGAIYAASPRKLGWGLGYSAGLLPAAGKGGLLLLVRAGLDFLQGTQFDLSVALGWGY